jgi:SHS2 domain-containing protein
MMSDGTPDRSPAFRPYEAVDHTADLAYLARGRTLEELFENAAAGMFAFLVDPRTVVPRQEQRFEIEGLDREECLINWLQELLYWEEVRRMLYREFRVERAGPPQVHAVCRGEPFDPERHQLHTDIKAATYHGLEFVTEPSASGDLLRVRIVLDI